MDVCVAQALAYDGDVDSGLKEQGGVGVAEVVEPDPIEPTPPGAALELAADSARLMRRAIRTTRRQRSWLIMNKT